MKTEIKFGLLFSAAQLFWLLFEFVFGLQTSFINLHPVITNFFAIPAIIIMVYAILAKRTEVGGEITFFKALLAGVFVSVVVAVISPLVILIFHFLINPHFFTDFQRYSIKIGKMSPQEAKDYFNLKSYILQGIFGALMMGTITSLIVAAVIKKKVKV
ncbi:MAG: DUF4199 domain-containing protein [Ignavibacteria bacterium]|nr:DUF4199 domain-containing protein [Ignavibacteria bacterium]OIO17743.1 MAG: hypothetical protein AUJ54_09410 [Ignavibacteria bacterium CG1_02_37_35]PIS45583.1 MAG: DUF4199 domain-containing protein [Ignavibacteria bacterium CG08_land_8_20_14_0_20_37_9]PIX93175.1 MAG: DUF4199 domain-containing protein [Ignavibacteria bacterium CG_4_10_14_3_um_filter_37_18]